MNGVDAVETDRILECLERPTCLGSRVEAVASRVQVAAVQADPDALRGKAPYDLAQLFESASERRAPWPAVTSSSSRVPTIPRVSAATDASRRSSVRARG